jgi:eukaryotic-like serine/threonine-protein kinase
MTHAAGDEDLFAAALIMPAAERAHFLARACAGDAAALSRLTGLLDAIDDAADFIRMPASVSERPDQEIRSYRLLRELGEGGCGIAYLAEQLAPVKRQVAVKVIKPGMDTRAVVTRFEAERQLLALMDHPNVAKVFDAGSTTAGRPYFVMELVRGISITGYCDLMRLSIPERLQLFMQVCQAIQHAHHKGVMHRDIKPSNVLVTMHDGVPLVKVIDFGIAKATQGPLSERVAHTALEQLVGTPAYISPEQTELTQRNVDTRSDIYSLGVLLYELLTGCTPLDTQELMQSSAEELRRRVREEEPPTPSARLKAIQRSAKGVQGDLDWIVMRSLEKQPERRYQTVNDLWLDIQRHLRHEPIEARPPSLPYLVRKFARRNRTAFAGVLVAFVFIVSICALAIATSIQSRRVATERDRAERQSIQAERVSNIVLNVLATADPFKRLDQPVTEARLLDQLAKSTIAELRGQPEARARLLEAIGVAYRRRNDVQQSIAYLEQAVEIRAHLQDSDPAATVNAMLELASSMSLKGDVAGAQKHSAEADKIAKRRNLLRSAAYAKLLCERGREQFLLGKLDESQRYFEESLKLAREVPGARPEDIATTLSSLANDYVWRDDFAEAERIFREAVAILERSVSPMHPDRVQINNRLAQVLYFQGRLDEAEVMVQDNLKKNLVLFGANSWQAAWSLDDLAEIRWRQGRLAEAETYSRRSVAAITASLGEFHGATGSYMMMLARLLFEQSKYADAEAVAGRALKVFIATKAADHEYIASAEHLLGEVYLATARPAEAEAVLRASMERWHRSGALEWRVARSTSALGEALYRLGRTTEGLKYMTESAAELSGDPKAEKPAAHEARARVARYVHMTSAPQNSVTRMASGGRP